MIYKLNSGDSDSYMELEQTGKDCLEITITHEFEGLKNTEIVYLNKRDVYKLIGVLHLIHKEMEV